MMNRFFGFKTWVGLVLLGASIAGKAQNLVVNPSFESVVQANLRCYVYPNATTFNAAVNYWSSPTEGSPDVYHTSLPNICSGSPMYTRPFQLPWGILGQRMPRTGNAYVGFITYGSNSWCPAGLREYVQGRLSTPLTVGQPYLVEMYVAMGRLDQPARTVASNNIGVRFATDSVGWNMGMGGGTGVPGEGNCVYTDVPDLNYTGAPITAATGWTRIAFCYTPTEPDLRYLTIGNFLNDSLTDTTFISQGQQPFPLAYYFLDDVRVEAIQNLNAGTGDSLAVCPGDAPINLFDRLGAGASDTGTWSGPSALPGGHLGTFRPGVDLAGTYRYTVTDSLVCGIRSVYAEVTVSVGNAAPVIAQPAAVCPGAPAVQLTANMAGGSWAASCGNCISANGLFNHASAGPGTYTVTYTVGGSCAGSDSVSMTVHPVPNINASPDATICPGDSLILSASGAVSYSWSPATGLNFVTGTPVTAKPAAPVVYTVTGTDANGCTGSDQVSVSLYPGVTAGFSFSPDPAIADVPVQFTDQSQNAVTWDWQFGDSNTSQQQHPMHVYSNGGGYTVILTVTSEAGCKDTASKLIMVMDVTVNIPNIITPNGDGVNDLFEVTADDQDYKCSIYNRWGNLIFESGSPQTSWDGKTPAGKLVPTGTYFCVIEFTAPTGPYKYEGTVNVHY